MVKRLEDLAFQLEAERSDVERWYKKVVHEVSDSKTDGERHSNLITVFTVLVVSGRQ